MSQVNFDYRSGILEAADPATDREWCWFKGDAWITENQSGERHTVIDAPTGATVAEIKSLIRARAKGAAVMT
ncbi:MULTISPECIES: hypothetical protein [Aeromonas]|uniref:Uncharacterized protein n=1 Tax=Aeromonas allosaccharophila TaxID=656 RepID=A0AAX3NS51_9GAMM|nr:MULTISPECIES: hypothetical protein [Aeromonas]MBJ7582635.1 hypothetical protein [Aeromonas veronii]MBJ7582903.1 hypothetical protein [Aeromonas veronii]WED76999.1 hypothetical protein PYU98_01570 [Aeromonas allosaccharophila]BBQ53692.1 hypothetical protein WP2S18C03_27730 [Aeromonas veronii]